MSAPKRYRVTLSLPIDATVEVVAEDPAQAEDFALDQVPAGLCHHCSNRWSEGDPHVVEELTEMVVES